MSWPPKQMFVPPGFYESELDKHTVQELVTAKVIAPVHVAQVEQQMARASSSAWQSVCDLGLKPATLTDLEIRAQMTELRHRHPELGEDELVHQGMVFFKGHATPTSIRQALGDGPIRSAD